MALNKSLTGFAFGVLNEFLSILHDDGFARPSRFEAVIKPPKRIAGTAAAAQMNNPAPFQLDEFVGGATVRHVSMKCSAITMPGRTFATTTTITAAKMNVYLLLFTSSAMITQF